MQHSSSIQTVLLSVRGSALLCFELQVHLGIPIKQRAFCREMQCQISMVPISTQPKQ